MATNYLLCGLSENGCINVCREKDTSISSLFENLDFNVSQYRFTHNGFPVQDVETVLEVDDEERESGLVVVRACPRLLGGKGGFGALIRAMGMRVNKSRGRDASRDLSGRRMRDVNAEKQLAEWAKKEPERRKKKEEDKSKKRREMLEGPRHFFNDPEYMARLEENEVMVEDAVKQGTSLMGGDSNGRKRDREENGKGKKKMLMLGMEDLSSSSEEDSEEEEEESAVPTKKLKGSDEKELTLPLLPPPPVREDNDPHAVKIHDTPSVTIISNTTTTPSDTIISNNTPTTITSCTTDQSMDSSHLPSVNNSDSLTHIITNGHHMSEQESNSDHNTCNTEHHPTNTEGHSTNAGQANNIEHSSSTTEHTSITANAKISNSTVPVQPNAPTSSETNSSNGSNGTTETKVDIDSIVSQCNLDDYSSVPELEELGPDVLKGVLQKMGLKCGGTLKERAERLMSVKGVPYDEIDPSLFAGSKSGGGRGGRKRQRNAKK